MSALIHQPKNDVPAEHYYVFLSVDPDGTEGVLAMTTELGLMPLTTIDPRSLPAMREMALALRKLTGKKIVLAVFKRERTEPL